MRIRLLGEFAIASGGRAASVWPRPSARRLCELVLVSPGRRISRDLACDELFPRLEPRAAARSLSKALSMARGALAGLGEPGAALLAADLGHIWAGGIRRGRRRDPCRGAARGPGDGTGQGSRRDTRRRAGRGRGTAGRRALRRLGGGSPRAAGRAAPGGPAGSRQGPGHGIGPVRPRRRAGRLAVLPGSRPRLRGSRRRPGPRLLRAGPPGAGRARLRALPRRARAARAAHLAVTRTGVRRGRPRAQRSRRVAAHSTRLPVRRPGPATAPLRPRPAAAPARGTPAGDRAVRRGSRPGRPAGRGRARPRSAARDRRRLAGGGDRGGGGAGRDGDLGVRPRA